jgi:hypothetical protein
MCILTKSLLSYILLQNCFLYNYLCMIKLLLIAGAITMMVSCGISQRLLGIVVDGKTRKPIVGVGVKKPDSRFHDYTDEKGCFHYHNYGSGLPITLHFEKEGYKTDSVTFRGRQVRIIKLDSLNAKPSAEIQMEERRLLAWIMFGDSTFNIDAVNLISKQHFNKLIDSCINTLQVKQFYEISVDEHVKIMRCFNTSDRRLIKSPGMMLLRRTIYNKHYMDDLVGSAYYVRELDILSNGVYFAKLKMQLYGGKRKWGYAYYKVAKKS